jgi:hypothetical protein
MFVKGGSAGEMGRRLADDINGSVDSQDGRWKGLLKGSWSGGVSAAKGAAITGFYEGRAATSGIFEGVTQIRTEFSAAKAPTGKRWVKTAKRLAGLVSATISAPAGLAHALLSTKKSSKQSVSRWQTLAVAAANGALVGAAVGSLGGPLGSAIGAGAGALTGLVSPAAQKTFVSQVKASVAQAQVNDGDMGHEITNKRRDLVQAALVGLGSGARAGWDATVQ